MEDEIQAFRSFWYTRFQGALFLLALLTSGLGDALTGAIMIEQQGLMREGNAIVRYIISHYGVSSFIEFKIWFTFLVLIAPFLILLKSRQQGYWMINGYLASFFITGTLAMILNLQAAANEALFLLPEHVILIFITLVLILTNIGDAIDRIVQPVVTSYLDCASNDIMMVLNSINHTPKREEADALN